MRLFVQLADSRRRPLSCLTVDGSTCLSALETQTLDAVASPSNRSDPSRRGGSLRLFASGNSPCFSLSSRYPPSATVAQMGLHDLDTLCLRPVLQGGGGDGGSTCAESRSCYLEMYAQKKPSKVDKADTIFARWTNCLLSSEPLTPPCVVDKLGNMLNKTAVIRALQSKSMPGALRHIRGLKDVMDVKLTEIPSVAENALVRFHCPISGLEFNGRFQFFFMKCCGNALSQRALKELKAQSACPMCQTSPAERMPINGSKEEVEELRNRMDEERAKSKAEKAAKKAGGIAAPAPVTATPAAAPPAAAVGSPGREHSAPKRTVPEEADGRKHVAAPASEEAPRRVGGLVKARTAAASSASLAKPSARQGGGPGQGDSQGPVVKKFKAGEHVPAGATKAVYASIFTSSRKEEFQETYSCRSLPLGRN